MTSNAPDNFDASLGLGVAETWWELGKLLALRDDAGALALWAARVRAELDEPEANAITVPELQKFARVAYELLRAKFNRQNIANQFSTLMASSSKFKVVEQDQYLKATEPPKTFWANEYRYLLTDLSRPKSGIGWLNAAGLCPVCGEFFIRARSDQKFHNDSCRARFHNTAAYEKQKSMRRKHARSRGKGSH
jgi:hypothetical protein